MVPLPHPPGFLTNVLVRKTTVKEGGEGGGGGGGA